MTYRSNFYLITLLVFCCAFLLAACSQDILRGETGLYGEGDWGGSSLVLDLPVAGTREVMCVQGAGGDYSHNVTSTYYDLDLDTSNSVDEEVYAPVNGVARVHDQSATSGFGYHVNIDLGDGTYVVIAHLSEIFISDGAEVAAGQLIAYEGMTGHAQGDHIHLGLHQGDAGEDARNGVSIPTYYRVVNQTQRGDVEILSSEEFVCGIRSQGDAQDGHFYLSQLADTLWHPDGTLIKTPDNAQVYVLEDGLTRWIENEDVFWSLHYDFNDVVLVSRDELACYGQGDDLNRVSAIDAFFDTENQLWLVLGDAGDPGRERRPVRGIGWEDVMQSWGLDYSRENWPDTYGDTHAYASDWEPSATYVGLRDGTLVTEEDAPDLFVISGNRALPVVNWSAYLMMGFEGREVLEVADGVVGELHLVGDCGADRYCVDQQAVTTCGGGMDLSSGESGGDSWDGGGDDADEEEDTGVPDDEEDSAEEEIDLMNCDGQDACLRDTDGDGRDDVLLMADNLWLSSMADSQNAYVYGNGGCFDGTLSYTDVVQTNTDGYYEISFHEFAVACDVTLSLISTIGTDGGFPEDDMSNWLWWQNAAFCSTGQQLCDLQDNGTSWEEWLIAVRWDPTEGLQANGNGYVRNDWL